MSALHQGAVIAGKYELERLVGSGGMGSVWSARHRALDVVVAIKLINHGDVPQEEARIRFEREAKAVAQLDTRHVVQVHDYGIDGDTPYLVMELLKGETLADRLERERRLSLEAAAGLLGQVAKGLRKAHEASLVHRDLKPANIFYSMKDDEEVIKILDFGIVKATGAGAASDATRTGFVMGSVHYMSPEQARSRKDIDRRSDLWSVGVILFRALTGKLPFRGGDVGDVIVKICAEPIPVPTAICPDLPSSINLFFERALARSPGDRFQSAEEMAEAFRSIVREAARSGAPVNSAGREGPPDSDAAGPLTAEGSSKQLVEPPAVSRGSAPPGRELGVPSTSMPAVSSRTLVELEAMSFGAPSRARRRLMLAVFLAVPMAVVLIAFNWTGSAPSEEPGPATGEAAPPSSAVPPVPGFTEPSPLSAPSSPSSSVAAQDLPSGALSGKPRVDGAPARPPKARAPAVATTTTKTPGPAKSAHSTGEKRLPLP
jgi:serine/threonine-protein kinase